MLSSPDELWNNYPVKDSYEKTAWENWIKNNHKEKGAIILDKWRDETGDVNTVSGKNDLSFSRVRENRHPRKALDFQRFTQEVAKSEIKRIGLESNKNGLGNHEFYVSDIPVKFNPDLSLGILF